MNQMLAFLALVIGIPTVALAADPFVFSLQNAKVGGLPEGWAATKTGEGPGSVWRVVEDDTFNDAGKIGLWTKADAQTYFADLQVKGK